MTNEMLPCPFCGNPPRLESYQDGGSIIQCRTFMCPLDDVEIFDWSEEEVTRRWNTRAAATTTAASREAFQSRVQPWMLECFGPVIPFDKTERNHRFLEEALELVQACGCSQNEAHQLVEYVYGRDQGDINQEVGGVMVTLAALCIANSLDMHGAGETELARIWTKVEQIRAKQAAKPKHSPLPAALSAPVEPVASREALQRLVSRLEEIHQHPKYQNVWTVHQIHGGSYDGPTYVAELNEAKRVLALTAPVERAREPVATADELVCPLCGVPDDVVACDNLKCPQTVVPLSKSKFALPPGQAQT